MFNKILLSVIIAASWCTAASAKKHTDAQPQARMLNYYYGLMEYYSGYSAAIGAKELEETDIVMFAGQYALNEKDELKKQKGLQEVNAKLQKILQGMQGDTHEYRMFLRAELGDYDHDQDGFGCEVINNYSCIDLTPLSDAGSEGEARSVIERGLLFGKVSKIKVFFINTQDFMLFKYPAEKKDAFLKSRTDPAGKVDKEVFTVVDMEILPKAQYKRVYDNIQQNVFVPGMENNYIMIARIKSIGVYDNMDMKNEIGRMGSSVVSGQTLKMH